MSTLMPPKPNSEISLFDYPAARGQQDEILENGGKEIMFTVARGQINEINGARGQKSAFSNEDSFLPTVRGQQNTFSVLSDARPSSSGEETVLVRTFTGSWGFPKFCFKSESQSRFLK